MGNKVLSVKDFFKSYDKEKTYTVRDVSFEVKSGEVVGLVGKNGAGKSTIIKSVTGILPFEKGKILIDGNDVIENAIGAKSKLGYVPDVSNAFDKMTGTEYLNFVADIFGVDVETRKTKIEEFQNLFPLGESIDKLINSYSHGMKQKISIMASLISSPKLWILDEPVTGLDPQTTFSLVEYMKNYAQKGNAVVFSSHNLDIVEKICNRILIINNGDLVADIEIEDFKKKNKISLEKYFMELCK